MKCEICGREFKNSNGLTQHIVLSYKRGDHKYSSIQEYYDKFYRKEKEGYCIYCGVQTSYHGIIKGYPYDVCKHCKSKKQSTQKKRIKSRKSTALKRKLEIKEYEKENYKYKCELCGKYLKTISGLSKHISRVHKKSIQEYYDEFFKKDNEGICPISGMKTNFISLKDGYKIYYKNNGNKDQKVKEKKKQTLIKKYGVDNPVLINQEKRIKKYRQTRKEKRDKKKIINKLIGILRIQTIDKNDKTQCQICGKQFNDISSHIIKLHKKSIQEYYDKFFKKDNEGICPISGMKTNFISLKDGYYKFKGSGTCSKDKDIRENTDTKNLKKYKKILKKKQYEEYNVEIVDFDNFKNNNDLIKLKCLNCNEIYENRIYNLSLGWGKCPKCYPRNTHISKGEQEIFEYLVNELKIENVLQSYTGLIHSEASNRPLELDIYIPDKNIAIEFNGLYWHSEAHKDDNYHLNKYKQCDNIQVQLIQIFEDEWTNKKNIVKSRLRQILGENKSEKIYARKCEIKEIDPKTKNKFLEEYHIQGKDYSNIKLGAFYQDKLISVMTFSKGNISRGGDPKNKHSFELNRFCSDYNYHIIGIAGKLLKHFQRNYIWDNIYSYADLRWSNGNLYDILNFNYLHITRPDYFYLNSTSMNKRIHRYNLRKTKLDPIDVTERKLRKKEGYLRIYDCGKKKYILNNNSFLKIV